MSTLINSVTPLTSLAIEFKALGGMRAMFELELGAEDSLLHVTYEKLANMIDSSEDYDSDIALVNNIIGERFNY